MKTFLTFLFAAFALSAFSQSDSIKRNYFTTNVSPVNPSLSNVTVYNSITIQTNLTVRGRTTLNNTYVTNLYATNLVSSNFFTTNLYAYITVQSNTFTTNLYTTNLYSSNIFTTNLFATIEVISNVYATNMYTTNLYTSNLFATNIYTTNLYSTINVASNVYATNIYTTNLYTSNLFTTNLYTTNLYTSNLYSTNIFTTNLFTTNLYSSNIFTTNLFATNIYTTNLYTSNLYATNIYSTNLYSTNIYVTQIIETNAVQIGTNYPGVLGDFLETAGDSNVYWSSVKQSALTITNPATGLSTVINGDTVSFNSNSVELFGVDTNGVATAAGYTNTAFTASGIVTNDASGKLYTTPTLPTGLLPVGVVYSNTANQFSATNSFAALNVTNNLTYSITSWGGPTNNLNLMLGRQQYTTVTNMAITNFLNVPGAGLERNVVLTITNSIGNDLILYITAGGVTSDDGLRSWTVTNKTQRVFSLRVADTGTNVMARSFY